jgi:PAS domain S-box-containing protein
MRESDTPQRPGSSGRRADDFLYRYLVDSSPVGAWVLDQDGVTVWCNAVMSTFLGRSREELQGFPARDAFDEEGRHQFDAFLGRMRVSSGSEPAVECLLHRGDGTTTWVLISADTLVEPEETRIVMRVVDYDVRRSLTDELRQAQTLGRMGSWRIDYATGETSWSQEMFRLVGRDPALGPMSTEDFAPMVVDADQHLLKRDRPVGPFSNELRVRRPGGDVAWFRVQGRVTGLPGGEPGGMLATIQEITEQKTLEMRLLESIETSAFLRSIASAANRSATLASSLDRSFQQMLAFDSGARLLTFQPLAAVGDEVGTEQEVQLSARYPGRDYSGQAADQLTPTRRELELAQEVYRTQETRIDDVTVPGRVMVARAVRYAGEVVVVVVLTMSDESTDHEHWLAVSEAAAAEAERVMDRERVNVELAEARDEAMSASRQKSDFLATMSHEIRTPMNGVIGLNDLLLRTSLDGNQRRLAEGVQAAGRSLLVVINDILDFSKIEAGMLQLESVDFEVRQVFDSVLGLEGGRAHAKRVELAAEVLPDVPAFVRGDPTRLSQILTNLVANAVKFTEEGEVIVTCSVVPQDRDDHDASGEQSGVMLRVEVADTGIGIPRDLQAGLFEPFSQAEESTTRRFGGTGLGLAICRQLVAAIGGEIGVRSEPGRGSTFWFTGRFLTGDPVLVQHSDGRARHLLEGRRLLVVDDNASNRRILAEVLSEWDTVVESASRATDAVERVRRASERGEPFDVVLLDLVMPDHTGLELASMITGATEEPWPTMLLLSSAQSVDREQLAAAGITRSLTKPVRRSALFDELVEILAEQHGVARLTEGSSPAPRPELGQTILVVEDNEINQLVATGVLEGLGYAVDLASDGEEAVEKAARGRYDAIVMDVQMPRMNGYTATRLIRSREHGADRVPIIAMTAAAIEGESERCLAAGMDAFLTKPLQPDRLEECLRLQISGRPRDGGPGGGQVAAQDGHLDISRLDMLRAMGPDASVLVRRAVDRFVAQAPDSVDQVRRLASAADVPELRRVAHRFGGSAANLGAGRVSALCQQMERLDDSDVGEASSLAGELERALPATLSALEAVVW